MAFVLSQSATYKWPVTLELPIDGGRFRRESFDAEFHRLEQSRINEIQEIAYRRDRQLRGIEDPNPEDEISDVSIADEILAGWSGILDENKEELEMTPATKKQLLEIPTVATAIITAYGESLKGAKRKNS